MSKYQGKTVSVVRAAVQGDPGFDAAQGAQVIIRNDNGTENTVKKSEVTE